MCTDCGTWGWWSLFCNLQPGICIFFWCPQTECKGVACEWGELPPKLARQLGRHASDAFSVVPVAGSETLGPVDSWGGRWETLMEGCGKPSWREVDLRMWEGVLWLPQKPIKLSTSEPATTASIFPVLLFLTTEPLLLSGMLLPSRHLLSWACLAPGREV